MVPKSFDEAFLQVKGLAERFALNESAYLSPKYQEAEVRQDFLDNFFVALGWDVYHKEHPNPYEREVKIEKSVIVGDRGKKADYAFYTAPNFLQPRFMAEAKKPSRQLQNQYDCFQAMRYGWNSNTPLAVLTDFEQFLVLDSRSKPSVEKAMGGVIESFHYSQFADEEAFRKIYFLFSREAVGDGSLDKFVASLKKRKSAKAAPAAQVEPVGDTFLSELDIHREELARSFKRSRNELDGEELTEITQRTLDRLVFIRFLEDKLVEPSEIIDRLGNRSGDAWRDFANEIPRLNSIYNGIIFKPHAILDAPDFEPDGRTFTKTVEWLSHKNSAYDFNTIPIHILGSIYERFLGKTITVTDKRAKVEEKPEVRKAGGVYYTPEYIVSYIVENTIGKLIEGKTPDAIAKMRFADIACGSGSFLLGIFDYLIKYHVEWYGANKTRREAAIRAKNCRETADGALQLTLEHKRDILLNNIYGVDLDAQAVEVAQLSLYLKLLEEETAATVQPKLGGLREQLLPNLNKNIAHGNSLIDYDILDGQLFEPRDLKKLNPMNFESAFPEVFNDGGFDAIVGNPPYVRQEGLKGLVKTYLQKHFATYHGVADLYVYFVERFVSLLKTGGEFGIIVGNKWLRTAYGKPLRKWLRKFQIKEIIDFGILAVFRGATTYTCILRVAKSEIETGFETVQVESLDFGNSSLQEQIAPRRHQIARAALDDNGWSLNDETTQALTNKLSNASIPLKSFVGGKLFYGIKTGLNDAFVIDDETRKRLVAEDQKSAQIIKPFLVGKDITRYVPPKSDLFVIFTRRGIKIDDYPAIRNYLSEFKVRLSPKPADWNEEIKWKGRKAGSYRWYEIQDTVDYFERFEETKILWPGISAEVTAFALDSEKYYGNDNNQLIVTDSKYALGILNSSVSRFFLRSVCDKVQGGFYRLKMIYVEQIPIRTIDFNNPEEKAMHDRTVELVEKMIEAKKDLAAARTDAERNSLERLCDHLDRQIDDLVYKLYDITPEERRIIEGN
jgi:type I restriction-modification system DNA methylase subunit